MKQRISCNSIIIDSRFDSIYIFANIVKLNRYEKFKSLQKYEDAWICNPPQFKSFALALIEILSRN